MLQLWPLYSLLVLIVAVGALDVWRSDRRRRFYARRLEERIRRREPEWRRRTAQLESGKPRKR